MSDPKTDLPTAPPISIWPAEQAPEHLRALVRPEWDARWIATVTPELAARMRAASDDPDADISDSDLGLVLREGYDDWLHQLSVLMGQASDDGPVLTMAIHTSDGSLILCAAGVRDPEDVLSAIAEATGVGADVRTS